MESWSRASQVSRSCETLSGSQGEDVGTVQCSAISQAGLSMHAGSRSAVGDCTTRDTIHPPGDCTQICGYTHTLLRDVWDTVNKNAEAMANHG